MLFRSEEFERARTGMKARAIMQGESAAARASSVAGDLFRLGRARTLQDQARDIQALTLEGVNRAIATHWNAAWLGQMTRCSIGPAPLDAPA